MLHKKINCTKKRKSFKQQLIQRYIKYLFIKKTRIILKLMSKVNNIVHFHSRQCLYVHTQTHRNNTNIISHHKSVCAWWKQKQSVVNMHAVLVRPNGVSPCYRRRLKPRVPSGPLGCLRMFSFSLGRRSSILFCIFCTCILKEQVDCIIKLENK